MAFTKDVKILTPRPGMAQNLGGYKCVPRNTHKEGASAKRIKNHYKRGERRKGAGGTPTKLGHVANRQTQKANNSKKGKRGGRILGVPSVCCSQLVQGSGGCSTTRRVWGVAVAAGASSCHRESPKLRRRIQVQEQEVVD
jgi:hypothetical protein